MPVLQISMQPEARSGVFYYVRNAAKAGKLPCVNTHNSFIREHDSASSTDMAEPWNVSVMIHNNADPLAAITEIMDVLNMNKVGQERLGDKVTKFTLRSAKGVQEVGIMEARALIAAADDLQGKDAELAASLRELATPIAHSPDAVAKRVGERTGVTVVKD